MELITVEEMTELIHTFSQINFQKEVNPQPYVEVNNDDHRYGEWKLPEGTKSSMERAYEIMRELKNCPYPEYIQPPRPRVHCSPFQDLMPVAFTSERRIFDDVKEEIEAITNAARDPSSPESRPPCEGALTENDSGQNRMPTGRLFAKNRPLSITSKRLKRKKNGRSRRHAARNVDSGPILMSRYCPIVELEDIPTYSEYNSEYEELDQRSEGYLVGSTFNSAEADALSVQSLFLLGHSPTQRSYPPSWGSGPFSEDEF
ncbi:GL14597 [Drosophila persimilis]|uniref:GL14597 n=1 Tax=Drosophila persimilis TaxID=7234 RepID=B4GVV0_DROPE|nr:GL14597 [Drosophila persimilis]